MFSSIRQARMRANLSQQAVADLVGCSQFTISLAELQPKKVSEALLDKIRKAVNADEANVQSLASEIRKYALLLGISQALLLLAFAVLASQR